MQLLRSGRLRSCQRPVPKCGDIAKDCNFARAENGKKARTNLESKMIFSFISRRRHHEQDTRKTRALADLHMGESAIVSNIELSSAIAEHLMNLGFVPGLGVTVAHSGPGGDPRVYRVDGTEVAMRRDVSCYIHVELLDAMTFGD